MKRVDNDAEAAWDRHNLSQLLDFRSLTLRQKMEAVEGMADVVRRFREMRGEGAFYTSSVRREGERADLRIEVSKCRGNNRNPKSVAVLTSRLIS